MTIGPVIYFRINIDAAVKITFDNLENCIIFLIALFTKKFQEI